MTKKYILSICILIIFLFSTTIFKYAKAIIPIEVKQVFINTVLGKTKLKESIEEKEDYLITVYYPETEYEKLNEKIVKIVTEIKQSFLEEINKLGKMHNDCKYELNITFNQYEYKSYISFAFDVVINLCGAHPYNYVFTVNYDTSSNKMITVNDVIKESSGFLNKISEKTYEFLKDNANIKEYSNEEMLKEGVKPNISNFENIIFDKDKLIVFINSYQVAPYVAGSFEIGIPYNEIFED